MNQTHITLILENIRSMYNVGAIFRSADVFGVSKIILTGITPYPIIKNDPRLPHVQQKVQAAVAKTALGTEKTVAFEHTESVDSAVTKCQKAGRSIYALEQAKGSASIRTFKPRHSYALILGNEVSGLDSQILSRCDAVLEIPQLGSKESLNVSVAAGIALFALTKSSSK